MSWFDDYLAGLPQTRFDDIRHAREKAPEQQQQYLAEEDRRAYAREQAYEKGLSGVAQQALLIPAEQALKGVAATGLLGSYGPQVLGRSGFQDPFRAIGSGYNGLLQGLRDRRTGYDPR